MAGETVAIIPCTNQKSNVPGPAREVWQGAHFQLVLAHAEYFYDKVLVLSYKYGLIEPDTEIEPYDINIKFSPMADKMKWWWMVKDHIKDLCGTKPGLVAIYTGYHTYERERVLREFVRHGVRDVIIPFEGASIGNRMRAVYDGEPPFSKEKLKKGEYKLPADYGQKANQGRPKKPVAVEDLEAEIPWED